MIAIQKQKKNLHEIIDNIEDNAVLNAVYSLLSKLHISGAEKGIDDWNRLTAEQQAEIEKAAAELDRGEGIAHDEVMKKYKGKYIR